MRLNATICIIGPMRIHFALIPFFLRSHQLFLEVDANIFPLLRIFHLARALVGLAEYETLIEGVVAFRLYYRTAVLQLESHIQLLLLLGTVPGSGGKLIFLMVVLEVHYL